MEITHFGQSSFRIRGKHATVVMDPCIPFPKHVTADIVTVSEDHPDHNAISQIEGTAYVVNGPGEYEIKGVGVIGRKVEKNTMYRIEIDGLSIVHLRDVNHTLSAEEVDSLDGVDILIMDVASPVSVIHEIEPVIVIPMRASRDELTTFLKEVGKEDVVPQPKLTVTRDKLPEQMQVVILE